MQQFEGKVQLVFYPIAFRPKGEGVTQAVMVCWRAGEVLGVSRYALPALGTLEQPGRAAPTPA